MLSISQAQLEDLVDAVFSYLAGLIPGANLFGRAAIDFAHSISKPAADGLYWYLVSQNIIKNPDAVV